jgi:hypothetical protein
MVTKRSGAHKLRVANRSEELEVSVYRFGTLARRTRQPEGNSVDVALAEGEVAIVEIVAKPAPPAPAPAPAPRQGPLRMTELGAYDVSTAETTPVLWCGRRGAAEIASPPMSVSG